jgi:pteridine reductase
MTASIDSSKLENHVVLVTGGARRVGAAVARALHAHGARLMIHYRTSAGDAAALAADLNRSRPNSAATYGVALQRDDAPDALVAATLERFGRLDVLINNASTFYATPVGKISADDWTDLMGSNLKGPLFLSQAAVPSLRDARGLIINMVDIHASRPLRGHPLYCVAKAGLAMLTRSLARELGPEIRVNGIAPGPVLWPEAPMGDEMKAEIVDKTALKRHGDPSDIARTALFLIADAPYVTGQIIAVDGGRSI